MEPKHLEHTSHESNQEMDNSQGNKKTRNEKSDKRKMMPKDPKLCDSKTMSKLLVNLRLFNAHENDEKEGSQNIGLDSPCKEKNQSESISSLNTNTCIVCSEVFEDLLEQRQHFKLDWHRYNLKRKLNNLPRINEDDFNALIETTSNEGFNIFKRQDSEAKDDDNDSLSGSETESEIDDSDKDFDKNANETDSEYQQNLLRHPKLFFNSNSKIFSIYRCILSPISSSAETEECSFADCSESEWLNAVYKVPKQLNWAIFMLGGGHFAAAVFNGDQVMVHKTFHCYTVRRKQGGGQSSADNKSGTNHPKSAGASLRRYNEASLAQHVKDIIKTWNEQYLSKCHLIFYRAASGNKKVLFGSVTGSKKDSPILHKGDPRIRTIPFPTRRATFKEVKRVHDVLITVKRENKQLSDDNVQNIENEKFFDTRNSRIIAKTSKQINAVKIKSTKNIRRSKSRESPNRQLPDYVQKLADHRLSDSDSEYDISPNMHFVTEVHSTRELMEFDNSPVKKLGGRKKKPSKKKIQNETNDTESISDNDTVAGDLSDILNDLITSCKVGNYKLLKDTIVIFEELMCPDTVSVDNYIKSVPDLLNKGFGETTTALHIASQNGHKQLIDALLEHGSDPTIKDKQKKTPYNLAPSREVRNVFRRYQAKWPHRYNWADASVPTTDLLTPEEEARQEEKRKEKRKAQRQAKKEKEKVVKEQKVAQIKEQQDREAFLKLSDREKRALAAERRIIAAKSSDQQDIQDSKSTIKLTGLTLQRCYQCGVDITGKTPFEYQNFRFCTTACVKLHRQKKITM